MFPNAGREGAESLRAEKGGRVYTYTELESKVMNHALNDFLLPLFKQYNSMLNQK